ncbi:cholecystokinin [Ambystoma mexicanum]|uniref:cholecystokinin n=1 Tax=Ambystoma mexicanum TaxID=8296 RepID=UPI0037E786C0
MYRRICICVLLTVLSVSSSGQQTAGSSYGGQVAAELEKSLTDHHRPVRTPSSTGQLKPFQRMDRSIEQKANLGALVARYIQQRKGGPSGRYAIVQNRPPVIDTNHRINDRDYMGWMDFGRRSAEEYEYSS